jgi:hypothetical protein
MMMSALATTVFILTSNRHVQSSISVTVTIEPAPLKEAAVPLPHTVTTKQLLFYQQA